MIFRLCRCEYLSKRKYLRTVKQSILGTLYKQSPGFIDYIKTAATVKADCFNEEKEWRIISLGHISDDDENIQFRSTESMVIPYYSVNLGDLSSMVEIIIGNHPSDLN